MKPFAIYAQYPRRMSVSGLIKLAGIRAAKLSHPTVLTLLVPHAIPNRNLAGFGEELAGYRRPPRRAPISSGNWYLGEDPPKEPNSWDSAQKAISSLSTVVGAGTKYYVGTQDTKLLQSQADAAAARTQAAQRQAKADHEYMLETQRQAALRAAEQRPEGLPSWVIPVAIGGVLLAAVGGYFIFKKKAV